MENKEADVQRDAMWRERLEQLSSSGMTQKDWCRENNIPESTLRYWIRKLRPEVSSQSGWVQLSENASPGRGRGELAIACPGVEISISAEADPALRERLIKAMISI